MPFPFVPYLILCLIAAFMARDTRMGFVATLVLAFFLTPIPVFLGLLCFVPAPQQLPAEPADS